LIRFQKTGFCGVIEFTAVPDDEEGAGQIDARLAEICDEIAWDEQVRVVVLAFGAELNSPVWKSWVRHRSPEQISPAGIVAALKQPVIAAIRGDAIGFALELAMACDLRIGTENARFGLEEIRDGLIPSNGGTQRLPRLIGQSRAAQMIFTGETIDAGEACRTGLLHRVVAPGDLTNCAMQMSQDMAAKSPLSLSYAKEALRAARDLTIDQGLKLELDLYLLLFSTTDRVEGITAFKEKRKPEFKGV
jgi:hypothetical protein